jgi:hypothetical protein
MLLARKYTKKAVNKTITNDSFTKRSFFRFYLSRRAKENFHCFTIRCQTDGTGIHMVKCLFSFMGRDGGAHSTLQYNTLEVKGAELSNNDSLLVEYFRANLHKRFCNNLKCIIYGEKFLQVRSIQKR